MRPRLKPVVHLARGQLQSTSHYFIKLVPGGQCLHYKSCYQGSSVMKDGKELDRAILNIVMVSYPKIRGPLQKGCRTMRWLA